MAKISAIKQDADKVDNGTMVRYAEDIMLRIANINNAAYREARTKILKPFLRQIRSKAMTAEEVLEVIKPAVAKHLLLGWENLQDDTGTEIEYSAEQALKFFRDPALSDLFMFVIETAGENELYRVEEREESEKNS